MVKIYKVYFDIIIILVPGGKYYHTNSYAQYSQSQE